MCRKHLYESVYHCYPICKECALEIQNDCFIPKDVAKTAQKSIPYCATRSYTSYYYQKTFFNGQWRLCKGQVQRSYCFGGCYSYYNHDHFNNARHFCYCCKPRKFTCDFVKLDCGGCHYITVKYEYIRPTSCDCARWYVLEGNPD